LGLLVLLLSSALEYLFPPFPGDSVTVLGGVYAVRAGVHIALVFAALMAGSLAGSALDWAVGRWLGARLERSPHDKRFLRFLSREQILEWEERFRHRGTLWLVLNRFLPGVRGPIFLAAGASGISLRRVLVWGGTSSLVWNALLFAAGYAVGGRAERLEALVRSYSQLAWGALGGAFVGMIARWAWRRRKLARAAEQAKSDSKLAA